MEQLRTKSQRKLNYCYSVSLCNYEVSKLMYDNYYA